MGKSFKAHNKSKPRHHRDPIRKPFHSQRKDKNSFTHSGIPSTDRTPYVQKKALREDQVGVTEYVSTTPGFTAVIKSRYSDFHVNEIDCNGEVLQLTDLNIPKGEIEPPLNESEKGLARDRLKESVTDETFLKLENLTKSSAANVEPFDFDVSELDKEKRTEIHTLLKQVFPGKLVSSTITIDQGLSTEKKCIKITKPKNTRAEKRVKWAFPGEYVNFLVLKENLDTAEVATHIAKNLNLMASKVNYCGTKDKRGITTQKFCVKHRTPSEIIAALRNLRNVHVGNFSFTSNVLKLGNLKGNRFRIALRHVDAAEDQVVHSLKLLREQGFINYYGMQRFGNCIDVPTYEVGVALLKADYKKACELILKPREGDPSFLKAIREAWWTNRDSKAAAAMFRYDRFIEKKLLDGLAKYGEHNYATALRKLPRNLLLLYPHAFQSLVFNRIASRRIKQFALQLIPGDLVYRNKEDAEIAEYFDSKLEATDLDVAGDDCDSNDEIEAATDQDTDESKNAQPESEFKRKVRPLTQEDIESGKFSIFDVVLPLPGYDITYPDNEVADWYKQILDEYGLSSDALNHNVKTFKMAGAYRKLLVLPKDISWEFLNYENPETPLIISDWDVLRNSEAKKLPDSAAINSGQNRALLLDFCLPTATYATMLLRELLKADTSSASQSQLETETKKQQKKVASTVLEQTEMETETGKNEENVAHTMDTHISEDTIEIDNGVANVDEVKVSCKRKSALTNESEPPPMKIARENLD